MKSYCKKIGKKYEPFILFWNLLTIITLNYFLNIIGISIYIYCDKKFRGKYLKGFILNSLLTGIICFLIDLIIFFPTMFILGFDASGHFGAEKATLIIWGACLLVTCVHIFYSCTSAKIYREQKNLCHEEEGEI